MRGQPRPREHGAIAGWQRHPPGPRRHSPGWWGSRAQPPSAGARTRPRESRCGRMTEAPVRFQQATASPAHGPRGTKRTVPGVPRNCGDFSARKESIQRPASGSRSGASQDLRTSHTGAVWRRRRTQGVPSSDSGRRRWLGHWLLGGIVFRRRFDDVDVALAAFGAGIRRWLDHRLLTHDGDRVRTTADLLRIARHRQAIRIGTRQARILPRMAPLIKCNVPQSRPGPNPSRPCQWGLPQ